MKLVPKYADTILLGGGALTLLLGGVFLNDRFLNSLWSSELWEKSIGIIQLTLIWYGIAFALLSLINTIAVRQRNTTLLAESARVACSLPSEIRKLSRWLQSGVAADHVTLWLAMMMAVGLVVRSYFLAQPMRYDEAFTFLNFVNNGLTRLFFYPLPNNHVLHTLLVRVSVEILGSHPVAIRLPSLLAGACVVPMSFYLARRIIGNRSGLLTSALVTVFPYLVLYDTMARGYSLVVLLSLCLAILGLWFCQNPSTAVCFLISFVTASGFFTMPSFLFPAAGLSAWIVVVLVIRRQKPLWIVRHFMMPCLLMTATLTALFYTPTIIVNNGIHTLIANRFVESLSWPEFSNRLPGHLVDTVGQFSRNVPPVVIGLILLLMGSGLYFLAHKRQWVALLLIPALGLGGAAVLLTKHVIPFDRTWIYVLPFTFIFVDAGLAGLLKCPELYKRSVLLILVASSGLMLMNRNIIASYPDTGHFPEAPFIVDVLSREMNLGDKVAVKCPADAPVDFYMWYMNVPNDKAHVRGNQVRRQFFVVMKGSYSLSDLTSLSANRLAEYGNAELYVSELINSQ
jgi:hypothetical protein